jgi:translation initiation factor IF-2
MSEPRYQEVLVGRAEVRALFRVPGVGQVAGLYVKEGKITRSSRVRVIREGREVAHAPVASLKRFKEDVREVGQGYECGLALEGFSDFQVGDTVEAYVLQEVP